MQKAGTNCWLFVGVLLCVLVIDWFVVNYNQQCSLYVQLDTAAIDEAQAGGDSGGLAQLSGLRSRLVDSRHSNRQSGIDHFTTDTVAKSRAHINTALDLLQYQPQCTM